MDISKPVHVDAQPGDLFGFRPGNSSKNRNTDSQDIPDNEDHHDRSAGLEHPNASDIYLTDGDKREDIDQDLEHPHFGSIFLLPSFSSLLIPK
jgi:hypothetical protein